VTELVLVYQLKCMKGYDAQTKAQMETMKANNGKATKLNEALKAVNTLIEKFGAENDPNKKRSHNDGERQALETALRGAGIDPDTFFGPCYSENDAWNANPPTIYHAMFRDGRWVAPLKPAGPDNVSLSDFRTGSATLKGQIETNSSTQSMTSLELQQTMGLRNQCFDIASSTVQKTGDADRGILSKF